MNENRRNGVSGENLLRIAAGFFLAGLFLFFHVWWPIQSERNLKLLRKVEAEVAMKKAELNAINSRFETLTSLTALDHWAKKHGSWRPATANDIITIS